MFAIERLRKQVVPGSTRHLISTGALVACLLTISLVGCAQPQEQPQAQAEPNAKACETLNEQARVDRGSKAVVGFLDVVLASEGITSELAADATEFWDASQRWQTALENASYSFGSGASVESIVGPVERGQKDVKLAASAIVDECTNAGVGVTGYVLEQAKQ